MTRAYRVPAQVGESLVETKGSRFYGRVERVSDEADALALLAEARRRLPDAGHHAFAYRLGREGETARFGDDGEPGGTAGRPIMENLLRNDLVDATVIVSRVFGGVLLGTGGLIRAYGGAAAAALRHAGVITLEPHTRLHVTVDYDILGAIEQEMRLLNLRPPTITYAGDVTLVLDVPTTDLERVRDRVADVSAGRALLVAETTSFAAV